MVWCFFNKIIATMSSLYATDGNAPLLCRLRTPALEHAQMAPLPAKTPVKNRDPAKGLGSQKGTRQL